MPMVSAAVQLGPYSLSKSQTWLQLCEAVMSNCSPESQMPSAHRDGRMLVFRRCNICLVVIV